MPRPVEVDRRRKQQGGARGDDEPDVDPEDARRYWCASYLNETSGGSYLVGHIDDTGTLDGNLIVLELRAAAAKEA